MTTTVTTRDGDAVSVLQGDAWAAWNASYHAPNADAYRVVGRELYRQDLHDRIAVMLSRSDEQNRRLDAVLAARAKPTRRRSSRSR